MPADLIKAHPLVTAEWPWVTDLPPYDFEIATESVHLGVYVRRVSGSSWHTLAGLINHVVVAPELRGGGLGSAAVSTAAAWLAGAQVPYAILHTYSDQAGFYERLGFVHAPNYPAPAHRGRRVSLVAELTARWPDDPVEYVEPW